MHEDRQVREKKPRDNEGRIHRGGESISQGTPEIASKPPKAAREAWI